MVVLADIFVRDLANNLAAVSQLHTHRELVLVNRFECASREFMPPATHDHRLPHLRYHCLKLPLLYFQNPSSFLALSCRLCPQVSTNWFEVCKIGACCILAMAWVESTASTCPLALYLSSWSTEGVIMSMIMIIVMIVNNNS